MINVPVPANNTGIGVHDDANCYWKPPDHANYARMLYEHGIRWYTFWCGDENKADWLRALVNAGIMPIVRFYPCKMPKAFMNAYYVEQYRAAGAVWFLCGNEFNLNEEWESPRPENGPELCAQRYMTNADMVRERGGWPLTPPPSLGGHVNHRVWFRRFMAELARLAEENNRTLKSILYPGGIGLHCRTVGNPMYDGPADYDCSAREWEWFDAVVMEFLGEHLPMMNTEAYDEPNWSKRLNPALTPLQKWEWWRSRNIEQMRWFDPNFPTYQYPEYVLCNTFWLLHDGGTWNDCGLIENYYYDVETGRGRETQLWHDMKNTITWVRGDPVNPDPTPPPLPETKLRVYDINGTQQSLAWAQEKYGVGFELTPGTAYHCTQMREISGPSGIDVYVYKEDGTPAEGVRVEFWWPDGMDFKLTEVSGKAGFGYGPGAYITNPEAGGPHWIVVDGDGLCDKVTRLGMLAGTPHDHLDLVYQRSIIGEAQPEDPADVIMPLAEELLGAMPVPADWALPAAARAAGFPIQVGGYGRTNVGEAVWVYQTFTREAQDTYVVAFCEEGDWQNVQVTEIIRD